MTTRLLLVATVAAAVVMAVLGVIGAGCGGGTVDAPAPSRVDVVLAEGDAGDKLAGFCEVLVPADKAQAFVWPELDGAAPAVGEGWLWVGLWATWCGPCIEEMPLIERWDKRLESQGVAVTIRHVSVDASAEDLSGYRKKHADAPEGPRVEDQASVEPWLTSLGLDRGAAIPIHVFVDPQQRVRCVRVGAVSEPDYKTVEHLLEEG